MSIETLVIICFIAFVLLDLVPAGPGTRKFVSWAILVVLIICLVLSTGLIGGGRIGR
jgi:hypothetical protein